MTNNKTFRGQKREWIVLEIFDFVKLQKCTKNSF